MRMASGKNRTVFAHHVLPLLLLLLPAVSARAERLPIRTYTAADGLGSSFINYLTRDSRGFLWFCTRDGLSRFDGQRFVTYNRNHGLTPPTINHLLETRAGVYWIATQGGGVNRFNPAAGQPAGGAAAQPLFTAYTLGHDRAANHVNVLYEDRAGQLWAGTDGGLFRLDVIDGREMFRRVETGLPRELDDNAGISGFAEDAEGSLWMGTGWGLLRRLPGGRTIRYTVALAPPAGDPVSALHIDQAGRIWGAYFLSGVFLFKPDPAAHIEANGEQGSSQLNLKIAPALAQGKELDLPTAPGQAIRLTTADGLGQGVVRAIHQSSDGRIWISIVGVGLTEFDGRRFHTYTTAHGLSDNTVGAMVEDRDGNLWISSGSGAMKLALNGFTTYDATSELGNASVHAIFADAGGDPLIVSGRWMISRFDGQQFSSVSPALPDKSAVSWASDVAAFDSTGQWWMLANNGLYRFAAVSRFEELARRQPQAVYNSRNGLTGDSLSRLFEDSRGDLWISTRAGDKQNGLTRWARATETFHSFSEQDGLPVAGAPSAFREDRSGNLWVGFYDGGLARYAAGRFTLFGGADGVPDGLITTLFLDRRGRLWIASSRGGLSRLDDPAAAQPRFVTYNTANGLGSDNVRCITEDASGNIYAGTVRGVDRLDPETGRVKHYTTADGLANDFVTVAFRDRHDALWFGTLRGLSRFIPQRESVRPAPSILIAGLRIAGVRHPISELGARDVSGFRLKAGQNNIQVDFLSIGFNMGEILRYQYRLEGADSEWSAPTDVRTVTYANLQPGTYRFVVRAVNADGIGSEMPATLNFTIMPPLWQRWWSLALLALLISGAVYLIYRYRVRHLLELERVRTRIATDLHDDIGSSLSQIAILSEVVRQRVGRDDKFVSEPLSQISGASSELIDTMSDIVWAIDPRKDHLSDLTQRMRRFASDVFTARNIEFSFRAPDATSDRELGADVRRQVFLIFKESVNNVVRHSRCTQADIEFRAGEHGITLIVRDNGSGFDADREWDGHGLVSMRQRTKELGGDLKVVSGNGNGHGTTVTLHMPGGRAASRRRARHLNR